MGQIEQERPVYKSFSRFALKLPESQHILITVLIGFCVALGFSARAQVTANWTGKGNDSLWTDANNWDTLAVPGANGVNDAAVINLQGSNFVFLNTNLTIGSISLGNGQGTNILEVAGGSIQFAQALSIATNGIFQIQTNLTVTGGNFQNSGTIILPPGLGSNFLTINCNFTNYGVIEVETNSTLDFNAESPGPSPQFESGTTFAGPGTVQFISGELINCDGTITVDGTIVLNSVQAGDAIWTGPGLLQFIAGSMNNDTFSPGFNVQLISSNSKIFEGTCTNEGTIRVLGSGELVADPAPYDSSRFYNSGLFQIETNFDLENLLGFQNTGTIKIPAALGVVSLTMDCPFTNYGTIDVEANSTLNFVTAISASAPEFESGTVFAGPGTVELISGNQPIYSDGTITVDGTFVLNIPQAGDAIWTGPGLLQFVAGSMGNDTFAPGFNVQLIGPDSKTFEGACTNEGTIRVLGTGGLVADPPPYDSSFFYNAGVFQIETNFELDYLLGFQNAGTIKVPSGLGPQSLALNCPFTNSGVIDVETNSELDISNSIFGSGSQTYLDGTSFTGPGTVSFMGDDIEGIACYGTITANGRLDLQTGMSGASTWTGSGLLSWLSGAISSITFAPGFHAQISGPNEKFLTGTCTNLGTVCWLGGSQLNDTMTCGQFNNAGILQIKTDGIWNNIPIKNESTGTFHQFAGTFSVASFTNGGAIQVANGFLNVATNFFSCSNSSYQVTVSGTTPGTNFNQLTAQSLTLGGSLQVILTNGFSPGIGNSFAIMNGTRSGSFSSTVLPSPQNNLMWGVQYAPASVVLEAGQPGVALTNTSFANGAFQFSLNGFPSSSYDIQASTNLIDWTTILTNYPFSGSVTITDTNAADFGYRFYRARIFP